MKVKASAFSSDEITIPLSQRTMLHQFPITESDTPKKGECKIILGSSINARQIINDASLEAGGDRSNVTEKLAGTTLGCFGLLAMSTKFVATAVAGGYATAQTAGAAAPVIIPAIVADASGVLTAGFYCTLKTGESMEAIGEYQVAENQKLFTKTLLKHQKKQSICFRHPVILAASSNYLMQPIHRKSYSQVQCGIKPSLKRSTLR